MWWRCLRAPGSYDWDFGAAGIGDPWVWVNSHGFCEMVYATFNTATVQHGGYAVSPDCKTFYRYTMPVTDNPVSPFPGSTYVGCPPGDNTNGGGAGDQNVVEYNGTFIYSSICNDGGHRGTMTDHYVLASPQRNAPRHQPDRSLIAGHLSGDPDAGRLNY